MPSTRTTTERLDATAPCARTPSIAALVAAAALATTALTTAAHAQFIKPDPPQRIRQPEMLPGAMPQRDPVEQALVSLDRDGATTPISGDPRLAWDACLGMMVERMSAAQMDRSQGTLVLADGQRVRGTLQVATEGVRWKSRWLGQQPVRPEGMRALIVQGDDAPVATQADLVVLVNGDRMEGVVAGIDPAGVRLERGAGSERTELTLPWDRVRSISFVGVEQPAPAVRVWLTDGSVLGGPAATWTSADVLQIGPAPGSTVGARVNLPRVFVTGVSRAGASLTPLASATPSVTQAGDGEGLRHSLTPPQHPVGRWPLDAVPIEVEGPVKLTYAAPAAASTLTMQATLHAAARAPGVVDLVVRSQGRELHRTRLDGAAPTALVVAELPAAPFEIELLAADGSAIGDFVRLERALLVARAPA